jgi:hypothetical protein
MDVDTHIVADREEQTGVAKSARETDGTGGKGTAESDGMGGMDGQHVSNASDELDVLYVKGATGGSDAKRGLDEHMTDGVVVVVAAAVGAADATNGAARGVETDVESGVEMGEGASSSPLDLCLAYPSDPRDHPSYPANLARGGSSYLSCPLGLAFLESPADPASLSLDDLWDHASPGNPWGLASCGRLDLIFGFISVEVDGENQNLRVAAASARYV